MTAVTPNVRGPFKKTSRTAFVNFLRAKYEMYTGVVDVQAYPYYLTLEPSDICQLRCPTCVTGIENELRRRKTPDHVIFREDRSKLSSELFDALMDELGERLFFITFYNFGEPLLNKNLPTFIRKASGLGIETDINTNLSLSLSDQFVEELLTSGLDYLFASIDGFTQEAYQQHRVGGNVELAKANLEKLVRARDRLGLDTTITYNFLVFRFNEHEVKDAARFCEDLGIYFNTRDAFIHREDWLPTHRTNEKPAPLPKELELPAGFGRKERGAAEYWTPLPNITPRPQGRCSWHYGYSSITAGGKVTPCCMIPHERFDFGEVVPGQNRFADVWNNDAYRRSRADWAGKEAKGLQVLETVCSQCPAPTLLYHLYSFHDCKVFAQAHRLFQGVDPLLAQAFDLLCLSRYQLRSTQLFNAGKFTPPENGLGTEDPEDIARFVAFFEQHFMNERAWAAAPAG
jgi:MoaA/NifB/PqqE/SkfB family radical SAM enzyme